MTELGWFLTFLAVMAWMGTGGWACAKLSKGMPEDLYVTNFAICLLLAPFAAGFAFVVDRDGSQPQSDEVSP